MISVAQVEEEAETKKYPKQEAAAKGTNVRACVGEADDAGTSLLAEEDEERTAPAHAPICPMLSQPGRTDG